MRSFRRNFGHKKRTFGHTHALFFFLPASLLLVIVTVYPTIYSIVLSLFDTKFVKLASFAGLRNYGRIFADKWTLTNFLATIYYVLGTLAISIPLGFSLALALNGKGRFLSLFRTILIIPWVCSQVVTGLLWKWLLDPSYGVLTYTFRILGFGTLNFLENGKTAMLALVIANSWRSFPLIMVMILAALQTVPRELYEASYIDGASSIKAFFLITLPSIRQTTLITTITTTINTLNMLTLINIFTAGGPMSSTETLALRVYREAFEYWNIGYSAALGMVLFLINITFVLCYLRVIKEQN